jgi:hypothetical protein
VVLLWEKDLLSGSHDSNSWHLCLSFRRSLVNVNHLIFCEAAGTGD